jgi:ribosomal protein S18 acetylase RimI-like enzyme
MNIRLLRQDDDDELWAILEPVIRAGETYALPRDMTRVAALRYWTAPDKRVFVAEDNGRIAGTYYLRANQRGCGDHVGNCGYMVAQHATGRGVGRALCAHSIEQARRAGFSALQFNFVVSTNAGAVRLWQSHGFEIVGRLPKAFRHPRLGLVDALVMYRNL